MIWIALAIFGVVLTTRLLGPIFRDKSVSIPRQSGQVLGIGLPMVTIPLVMICGITTSNLLPEQVDSLLEITNLSDLLHALFAMGAAGSSLLCLSVIRRNAGSVTHRDIWLTLGPPTAVAMLIVVEWLNGPYHQLETAGDYNQWETGLGQFGFVAWVDQTYRIAAFIYIGVLVVKQALESPPVWKVALTITGIGVSFAGLSQVFTLVRLFMQPQPTTVAALATATQLTAYIGLTIYSLGVLLPAPLARLAGRVAPPLRIRTLTPLWEWLTASHPKVVLTLRPGESAATVEERRYLEIGQALRKTEIPKDDADLIRRSIRIPIRLGVYLAQHAPASASANVVSAGALLIEQKTPAADRAQVLVIAKAYKRCRARLLVGSHTGSAAVPRSALETESATMVSPYTHYLDAIEDALSSSAILDHRPTGHGELYGTVGALEIISTRLAYILETVRQEYVRLPSQRQELEVSRPNVSADPAELCGAAAESLRIAVQNLENIVVPALVQAQAACGSFTTREARPHE